MAATLGAISFPMLARIGESPSDFRFFATKNAKRDGGFALNRRSSRRAIRVRVSGSIRAPSSEKMIKDFNG